MQYKNLTRIWLREQNLPSEGETVEAVYAYCNLHESMGKREPMNTNNVENYNERYSRKETYVIKG